MAKAVDHSLREPQQDATEYISEEQVRHSPSDWPAPDKILSFFFLSHYTKAFSEQFEILLISSARLNSDRSSSACLILSARLPLELIRAYMLVPYNGFCQLVPLCPDFQVLSEPVRHPT